MTRRSFLLVFALIVLNGSLLTAQQTWNVGMPPNAADVVATLSATGNLLTISGSGTGVMQNYTGGDAPWYSARNTIKSIVIQPGVTSIGNYAFFNQSRDSLITIGNTVASIGDYAFCQCNNVLTVTIPASVNTIGNNAFSNCYNLATMNVDSTNQNFSSAGGIVYNKNQTAIVCVPTAIAGTITIPSTITTINAFAFSQHFFITSVTIPNSVTSIEESAFMGCTRLASITIPESVTSIGIRAFYACTNLMSVDLRAKITAVEYLAFSACEELTAITIPPTVTSIGRHAFSACSKLASVTIPNSVTSIGAVAFANCHRLTSVTLPNSVKSIGDSTYFYCKELASVNIGDGVVSIGTDAFMGSEKLTSLTLGSALRSIGDGAFFKCNKLTTVIIPASVASIGEETFADNSALTSLTIGRSVTSIGDNAFAGCNSLTGVTNLRIVPQPINTGVFDSTTLVKATLTVPNCALSDYQTAAIWSNFHAIVGNTTLPCEDAIGLTPIRFDNITIYPNPVIDQLSIDNGQWTVKSIEIMDISGRTVYRSSLIHKIINVSFLPSGIYLVRIETEQGIVIKKIVKN